MQFVRRSVAVWLAVATAPTASLAADVVPLRAAPSSDWTVTIGAEGRVMPRWEGADRYMLLPFPYFNIRRAGTPEPFRATRDGFGFALLDTGTFRAGPVGKIRFPRNESDDSALRGLGDVRLTLEIGAFAEYWWAPWLRTRAEVRQGIGGHRGVVADLTADAVVPVTQQLTLSAGPRLTLATTAATSPYFSIDVPQSIASGLPTYDAHGGVRSVGAGAKARYAWTPQWATHAFVEYERLAGDAANAPLVVQRGSRDQFTFGVGATYSFDMRAWW